MTDTKQAVRELREALGGELPRGYSEDDARSRSAHFDHLGRVAAFHLPAVLDRLEELEPPGAGCCDLTMQPPPKECERIEMLKAEVEKLRARNLKTAAERDAIRAKFAGFREAIDAQAHEWEHRGIQYGKDLRDILARFPLDSSETTDGREG